MAVSYSLSLPKLGNTGVSSLIKSASTLKNEINTFNDTQQQITFENNPSEENLQSYLAYLDSRVTNLQSTGTITDATKALTMSQQMHTAVSTSTSFQIQNESIQIMSGNATPQDKLNAISGFYQRAAGIGDVKLAQSLESQAYSLSQTIQYQTQQASGAAQTLATANAGSQQSVATNLTFSLKQLNNDIKNSGQKDMNGTLQAWVTANSKTLETLGVKLPAGAQPNYFDLVNAVGGAIYNAHVLAYQAELPYNPATAQTYLNQAVALREGIDTLPTLAGNKTSQEIQQASANNAEYAYDANTGKLVQTKQTGFSGYDQNGAPIPTYSGAVKQTVFLTPTQTTMMTKLGLNFSENTSGKNTGTTGNGVQVQATQNTPDWLKNVIGQNGITNFFSTDKGIVFEGDTANGKSYFTLGTDQRGLVGLFENTADGNVKALGGEYGFNAAANSAVSSLIASGQQTQHTIQLQQAQQAATLKLATPPAVPNISLTPQTVAPTTAPVIQAPSTVSVQGANGNPQNATPNGASINQAPGSGVKITGTTNAPVGMRI